MMQKNIRLFSLSLLCLCLLAALPRLSAAAPVRVSTVEEFFKAIRPGANIIADIKESNITYALDYLRVSPPQWLAEHPYVELSGFGREVAIVVHDADGLTISGKKGGTSLSIEYLSMPVLSFRNCRNLTLRDLTLGHAPEKGSCSGDVLSFDACKNVTLDRMDLYGCGYQGIAVYDGKDCGKFLVKNSVIRDCSSGPLYIWLWDNPSGQTALCRGTFIFDNCRLTGSDGSGAVRTDNIRLVFNNCEFGLKETPYYQQLTKNTTFKNCRWMVEDCNCAG